MKKRWTHDELAAVSVMIGRRPASRILPGRSNQAVRRITERHQLRRRRETYTPREAAAACGTSLVVIERGLRNGLTFRWGYRGDRPARFISHTALVSWIQAGGLLGLALEPSTFSLLSAQVSSDFFSAHLSAAQLGTLLYCHPRTFSRRGSKICSGFPEPARCVGSGGAAYWRKTDVRAWLDAHPERWTSAAKREFGL